MAFTPDICLLAIGIEFFCFFIKGLAAFGDPLISTPLLSMIMDNRVISPMNLLLGTPINAHMAWKNRKAFTAKTVVPILIAILCGIIPGVVLLKYATSWTLKACLGALVIGIGVEMLVRDRTKPAKNSKVMMIVASFFSGVTAGLYGINLFFVAYVERTTKTREAFRGNVCFIFLVENIFRLIVYIISGVLTREVLTLALATMPGAFLGFFLGSRVDKRLSERAIRYIIIAMFMAGGVSILVKALVLKS
ncbi:conserved membrane hypothetical protein [uncultured spirochete]|uniref:Probable membrane transporter protein n=1 Tax=uncultured spirochete TaxID=156406 RepID=A0A3P3XQ86_9SPIR|nr:conserved membrane hypothetical protein [uncultured spirochete]